MTLYVNNSLLTLLASCETKTWVRWGQELVMAEKQGPGPMEVGQVLHVTLDYWLRGCEREVILGAFDATWREVIGAGLPTQERLHPANVRLCLGHWIDQQPRRDLTVLQTEATFEVPLGDIHGEEVIYYGTPDALLEWKGDLWVLDHKSTSDIDEFWGEQWTMNTGLQGYVWAFNHGGGPKVKGAFVNGMEVKRLPPWDGNMTKKCVTHKLKYAECQPLHVTGRWVGPLWWSEARLAQWKRDALRQVERLQWLRNEADLIGHLDNVMMDGQFRWPGCNGGRGFHPCAYRPWCQASRPVEGLTQMMVHQAWRREDGTDTHN